jgi:3-oxoacyl-[acyl-carrier protein] reductase
MDLGLKGKRALVMGGTKGLGRSIADSLAAEGAALVISGRDQGRIDAAAAELRAKGAASACGFPGDVANPDDMDALYANAVKAMGGVDILVLNHGGPPPCTALEIKEAEMVKWFTSIVVSPLRIANLALPAMRAQQWGRIIVVGSSGMQAPIPHLALSNVLRAGVWAWVKTISGEVAHENVTVNILAPGSIQTDRIMETATKNAAARGVPVEQVLEAGTREIPAGRYGQPSEYGPMGAFLAGETGSYITGSMIRVDGGRVRSML